MSERQIQHFLIVYDIANGHAETEPFGSDYDAAVAAYNASEHKHRDDDDVEVVLLGSDSFETLERTHSSYFELGRRHADEIVGRELAALGLR